MKHEEFNKIVDEQFERCRQTLCENCDECVEFVRIKPQYCARCGCDFLEREQNKFCSKCIVGIKKWLESECEE